MKNEKQAKKMIKAGTFLGAVKLIRDSNNIGLNEAKTACEKWREEMGLTPTLQHNPSDHEWTYNRYRALLCRNNKPFAIVTPDGMHPLTVEDGDALLAALNK